MSAAIIGAATMTAASAIATLAIVGARYGTEEDKAGELGDV
ncbi:MAG: hypothetical protein AAFW81_00230 [Pseudomonadota bacterium]